MSREKFIKKMKSKGMHNIAIENFLYNLNSFLKGKSSLISESDIENPKNILSHAAIEDKYISIGKEKLNQTVMIKLNGGLGTSMGLQKAKSLLQIKDGMNFLDIISKQTEKIDIPLILMNSANTRLDSLELLKRYEKFNHQILPLDFLQNMVPKISVSQNSPVNYDKNKNFEWCPPGHGDIYISMVISGVLDKLLSAGIEYAFISNADNLGATLDMKLLGYFARNKFSFLMETAKRTESDKKGGHLARNNQGKLILREIAQCPEKEMVDFQDYKKYTYFNTNNIWINLKALKSKLEETNYNLKLPVIINRKTVDPRDEKSEKVIQLETAMGSAIEIFNDATAICVDRDRFVPVKKTNDLMKIQSDLYELDKNYNLISKNVDVATKLIVNLDDQYYKKVDDYHASFDKAKIRLLNCKKLTIIGKFELEGEIEFKGEVVLKA